jgi:hypothetical protein
VFFVVLVVVFFCCEEVRLGFDEIKKKDPNNGALAGVYFTRPAWQARKDIKER